MCRITKSFLRTMLACVGLSPLFVGGCATSFKEKYYEAIIRKQRSGHSIAQFYRFRLHGWSSLFDDTRYESGWYDAGAVDQLFGEVTTPRKLQERKAQVAPTVHSIPLFMAAATLGTGNATGNATIGPVVLKSILIASPANLIGNSRASLKRLRVQRLTVYFQTATVANSLKATKIEISGNISARLVSPLSLNNISATATPASAESALTVKGGSGVSSAELIGGAATIVANGAIESQPFNGFSGPCAVALTRSAYHSFTITGGTFVTESGTTSTNNGTIEVSHGAARFAGFKTLTSTRGWTLNLQNCKPKLANPTLHFVIPKQEFVFNQFGTKTTAIAQIAFLGFPAKTFATALNATTGSVTLDDVDMEVPKGNTNELDVTPYTPTAASSSTISSLAVGHSLLGKSIKITQAELQAGATVTADSLSATSGSVTVDSSDAVALATSSGHAVALQTTAGSRGHTPTYVAFGPEGESPINAQDKRLVIFMSGNPQSLADEIHAMATTKQSQVAITKMLFGSEQGQAVTTAKLAKDNLSGSQKFAKYLQKQTKSATFSTLGKSQLRANVKQWISTLNAGG